MLEQFCCFRLEPTAKFFGSLGSFVSIILIIICAELLRNPRALIGTLTSRGYHFEDPEGAGTVLIIILVVNVVIFFINAFANAGLVFGTIKKHHKLILPWLIITALWIALSLVAILLTGFYSSIFGVALSIYLWLTMWALYRKIKQENEQRALKRAARYGSRTRQMA
ncbi:uncharacterized protein LOC105215992 [Zeugodacus cucurbitae]|uniref:Photosystem I assembly protein Ycf4 n=1 Tax=Zeugodacus cucurbitae TaxID=28588 RepID=A0A0A1WKZ0_ZEUCU|nr:uncharacterized protein LOC105215992 [Zeugodacus cucurbitae]